MNEGISILQWNCRGIYRKILEFKRYLSTLSTIPDLLILQETHLIERYSPKIQGYDLIRKDNTLHSGGLAIFAKDNLRTVILNTPGTTNIELQCIRVHNLSIYNIYIPPDRRLDIQELDFMSNLPKHAIIVGDFNARHHVWSNSDNPLSNKRDQSILEAIEWIDNTELIVTNAHRPGCERC